MKSFVPLVIAMFVFAQTLSQAHAGNCRHLIRQQVVQQVVAVPYYQAQQYVSPYLEYRVGQAIQDDAVRVKLAEDIANRVVAKLQAANAQRPNGNGATNGNGAANGDAGTLQLKAQVPLLNLHCARCHSGDTAKAGLILDGTSDVDDQHFRRVVEILGAGLDIPKAMQQKVSSLDGNTKGGILDEVIKLKPKAEVITPPAPQPAPEPGVLE